MFMKFGKALGADLVKMNANIVLPVYTICEQEEQQLMLDAEGKVFDYWACRLDAGIRGINTAYEVYEIPKFNDKYEDGKERLNMNVQQRLNLATLIEAL